MTRHASGALALVAALAVALLPRPAAASKADAFEGKIQPVSGQLYRKAGRLELTLGGALSMNDAFFQKGFGDLKLGYHLTEHWSASVHAAAGTSWTTGSTTVCPTGEGCREATDAELAQVPGRVGMIAGAEVAWSPIYGKLNVFSEKVAHVDLSLLTGVDLVWHDEVLSSVDAGLGKEPEGLRALGFHVGIGARVFVARMLAVRLELKDYVYGVTVPNGDAGTDARDVQNQIMAEIGLSLFFPFEARREP